ncbi:hypothetical protein VTP01DRAFT_61 [Rhizomucor pusillus]|uniref:uncharacterized protein n=1 Tax=Rhizomucor pusillus TaxID=4840 RepID=UPI003741FD1F
MFSEQVKIDGLREKQREKGRGCQTGHAILSFLFAKQKRAVKAKKKLQSVSRIREAMMMISKKPIIILKRRVQDEAAAAVSADKYKSTKRGKTKPNNMTNKTAHDDAKECATQSSSASAKTAKKVNKRILSVKSSLSLTRRFEKRAHNENTKRYRDLIEKYLKDYMTPSGFKPETFDNAQQISRCEGMRIKTAYLNSVKNCFGNRLRYVINSLLKVKENKRGITDDLRKQNKNEKEIRSAIYEQVIKPARELKLAIASGKPMDFPDDRYNNEVLSFYTGLINSYPSGYTFEEDTIYYDSKSRPENHIYVYVLMAKFCEANDIKTFQTQILHKPHNVQLDFDIWKQVVNFESNAFKSQGVDKSIAFKGTINTDGFGVSICKQNFASGFGRKPKKKVKDKKGEFKYIQDLDANTLKNIHPNTVFIDPGRRDLLYCMHQNSTTEKPNTYRYTRNQKAQDSKTTQYRKLTERIKPNDVKICESAPSKHCSKTVDLEKFKAYLKARFDVAPTSSTHYQMLIFRKLHFRRYLYRQRADDRLAKYLRSKFGQDPVLVIGDWSARSSTMAKFHEPSRGIGLLRKGFEAYLLDEFKTSSICPNCNNALEKFKEVRNPRPYRREKMPTVTCHGLLRCTNANCLQGKHRLWNSDLAAVLNFRIIMDELCIAQKIPKSFTRSDT